MFYEGFMDTLPLNSIAVPTLLIAVGLFFFIRASVKDRTEAMQLTSDRPPEELSAQLKQYFCQRAYQPVDFDPQTNQVVFEGRVGASIFLAVFLSVLAAVGFLCVGLVLSALVPTLSNVAFVLVVLSPLAGVFYWRNANRLERVSVKVEASPNKSTPDREIGGSIAVTIGHRDELAALQRAFPQLQVAEPTAE